MVWYTQEVTLALFISPLDPVVDASGTPIPSAKLHFFEPGTTTPKTVYTVPPPGTAHANPVLCDANGNVPAIYLDSGLYKVRFEDGSGNHLFTMNNVNVTSSDQGNIAIADTELTALRAADSGVGNASGVNYLTAMEAAFAKAKTMGIDTIVHNMPDTTIYGVLTGQETLTVDLGEQGSINGTNTLRAKQRRIVGAEVYQPSYVISAPFSTGGAYYRHQASMEPGLKDGSGNYDLIAICQGNPTERAEGTVGQQIYMSTSDNGGMSWGTEFNPFSDSGECTNPFTTANIDPLDDGDQIHWQPGLLNLQRFGIADKLWARWAVGRGSNTHRQFLPIKTKGLNGDKWTNHHFWFRPGDGDVKLTEWEPEPPFGRPNGYKYHALYEGDPTQLFVCHDFIATEDGRVLMMMVSTPSGGSTSAGYKYNFVMWTDNPGEADPEDINWHLGPSIPIGKLDPGSLWEWSVVEVGTNRFEAILRRNEGGASTVTNVGEKFGIAHSNDGITFGAIKWYDSRSTRTRAWHRKVNHVWRVTAALAHPRLRQGGQLGFARADGGLAQGYPVTRDTQLEVATDSVSLTSSDHTLWSPAATEAFQIGRNRYLHTRNGVTETLHTEGWRSDTGADSLVYTWSDGISAVDSLVIREKHSFTEIIPTLNAQSVFDLAGTIDLRTAPEVSVMTMSNRLGTLALGTDFTFDTATDNLTLYGGVTGISTIFVDHTFKKDTHFPSSVGDSIVDLGFDHIKPYEVEVEIHVDGTFQELMPQQDVQVDLAASQVEFLVDVSNGDTISMITDQQIHVPTNMVDYDANAIFAIWAHASPTTSSGSGGTDVAVMKLLTPPASDKLVIFPNDNAAVFFDDLNHRITNESDRFTLFGSQSAMASLDDRSLISIQRFQRSDPPSKGRSVPIVGVAGTNHFAELQMRADNGRYVLEVRELRDRAGVIEPITVERGKGRRLEDPTAVFGVQVFVDPSRNLVRIDDVDVEMPGPYSLYFGEFLLKDDKPIPTYETLTFYLDGIKQTYLDDNFSPRGELPAASWTPNLFLNPGFRLDPVRDGRPYATTSKTTVPPWAFLSATNTDSATVRRQTLSDEEASERLGWRHALLVEIEPTTSQTAIVKIAHPWRGVQSVTGPHYFCGYFSNIEDYTATGDSAPDDGILVHIDWLHAPDGTTPSVSTRLRTFRVFEERFRIEGSLPVPDPVANGIGAVDRTVDWCALQITIETEDRCALRLEQFDLYRGSGPRDWTPTTEDVDWSRLRPYFRQKRSREVGGHIATSGLRANTAQAHFEWELEEPMAFAPRLLVSGEFDAVNGGPGGADTVSSVTLDTLPADQLTVRFRTSNLPSASGWEIVRLIGGSTQTDSFVADGQTSIFTLMENTDWHNKHTGIASVWLKSGLGTVSLEGGTIEDSVVDVASPDYYESTIYDNYRDGPFKGNGTDSTFLLNHSVSHVTAIDVITVDSLGASETLAPIEDYVIGSTEIASITHTELLLSSTPASGDTVHVRHNDAIHDGHFITLGVAPENGDTVIVEFDSVSDAFIAADAFAFDSDTR